MFRRMRGLLDILRSWNDQFWAALVIGGGYYRAPGELPMGSGSMIEPPPQPLNQIEQLRRALYKAADQLEAHNHISGAREARAAADAAQS